MEKSGTLLDHVDVDTISTLERYIEQRVKREPDPVRAVTFVSDPDPVEIFRKNPLRDYSSEIADRNEFYEVNLRRHLKGQGEEYDEDGYRSVEGAFFVFSHDEPDIHTAFSICDRDFYKHGLISYLESLPSELSLSFLQSGDLRRLFEVLDDSVDGNLMATRAVLKSPGTETDVKYLDETPYFEVFNTDEVVNQGYYVDKIEFGLKQSEKSFQGQVSRGGKSRFVAGESSIYFGVVLSTIAGLLSDKDRMFANRSRDYGSKEADPITISYDEGTLRGRGLNSQLIRALDGLNKSSVTVYHDNPYMHASVLDYTDGSTADVFLVSDSNISVIPGFNSSRRALSRICDQINQGFREGEISVGRETERPIDDYFTEG